jgi:twitching motility protein PilT
MSLLPTLLQALVANGGSDLHLKVGAAAHMRLHGHLLAIPGPVLTARDLDEVVAATLPPHRRAELDERGAVDVAVSVPQVGRFRVNLHRQRGSFGAVVHRVATGLPTFDEMQLPPQLQRLGEERTGLVIVSGPAGSGRSTTAALFVDQLNRTRTGSILTVEDPIEFLHPDGRSIVTQREVGSDVPSVAEGVRRVLRHDVDVLYVSDVPDTPSAQAVLDAAVGGKLVITTMSGGSVVETLTRFVDMFPAMQQRTVRQLLATSLRAVVCQRLVPRLDAPGRIPAAEILIGTTKVSAALVEPDGGATLHQLMREGRYSGMQTLDQSLEELCTLGAISANEAVLAANAPDALLVALQAAGLAA